MKNIPPLRGHLIAAVLIWAFTNGCSQPLPIVNPVQPLALPAMKAMLTSDGFSGLVAVMASWCPPCRVELPVLTEFYDKYKEKGITIAAISIDAEGVSAVQPLVNELKIPYPVFWVGVEAARHFKIRGVPTLLVIRNGVLQQKIPGGLPHHAIESAIQNMLAAPADPNAV